MAPEDHSPLLPIILNCGVKGSRQGKISQSDMVHKILLKSSLDQLNSTGFPGDLCVAFLFYFSPGNKDGLTPLPLKEEVSHHVYNYYNKQLSGSAKH